MRRALILCGSARPAGATEAMCRAAAEALPDSGYVPEIVRIPVGISHCLDCGLCMDGSCVIDDGMSGIYRAFQDADLLVLATPIHFSGPSSLMKTAVDRFQPYWWVKDSPHPSMAIGLMCGGSDSPDFGPTVRILRAFSAMTGMEWLGQLEVSGTDRRGTEGIQEAVARFVGSVLGRSAER